MSHTTDDLTPSYVETGQPFDRDMNYVPDRITAHGRTPEHGDVKGELWPVEPDRYRLIAALIAVVIMGAVGILGGNLEDTFTSISTKLTGGGGTDD